MNHFYLLALAAGLVLPVQIAFNNKLTVYSGHPIISSLTSFTVGAIALLIYSLFNQNMIQKSIPQIWQAPPYAWLGGLVGCFYVVSTLVASPKIGTALSLGLVIGGQLCMSLLMDHFGWLGTDVRPFTLTKGVGVLLVLVGILLLKK